MDRRTLLEASPVPRWTVLLFAPSLVRPPRPIGELRNDVMTWGDVLAGIRTGVFTVLVATPEKSGKPSASNGMPLAGLILPGQRLVADGGFFLRRVNVAACAAGSVVDQHGVPFSAADVIVVAVFDLDVVEVDHARSAGSLTSWTGVTRLSSVRSSSPTWS